MSQVSRIKNGRDLFWLRLKHQFQFYFKIWNMTVDWVIWLYVLLPVLGFGIYFYVQLWKGTISWVNAINETAMIIIFLLLIISGSIKSFLKEADLLFLWQDKEIINELKTYMFIYFCLNSFLSFTINFLILAPVIIVYLDWPVENLIYSFLISYNLYILISLIKRELILQKRKWVYRLWMLLITVLLGTILFFIIPRLNVILVSVILIIGVILANLIFNHKENRRHRFYREVELEIEKKVKFVQTFYSQLMWIGGPDFLYTGAKNRSRKRPFLFRNSQKIFRKKSVNNGYVELFIKSLLRNRSWLFLYFRYIGIGSMVILLVPGKIKWIAWIAMVFLMGNVVKGLLIRLFKHPFLSVVPWPELDEKVIVRKCIIIALLPGSLILSLIFGYINFSLIGLIFGLFTSVFLTFIAARLFQNIILINNDRETIY